MAYKGYFVPKNPQKYRGNPTNIIYRSRWECLLMSKLDEHPDIIEWASEEFSIPYRSPIDNRVHRYYPDFLVRKKDATGLVKTMVIEVKPASQAKPPEMKESKNKRYIREVVEWGINSAKWEAAKNFCAERKWTFHIFTEKELGIKF